MIHSLSGGVIADNGYYTFAKVEVDGAPWWYLAEDAIQVGDRALVPVGRVFKEGVVLMVERNVSNQCAPVPMNRIKAVEKILK